MTFEKLVKTKSQTNSIFVLSQNGIIKKIMASDLHQPKCFDQQTFSFRSPLKQSSAVIMQLNWNERMGSNKAIQLRLLNIFVKLQAHNFKQAPAVFIKKNK